VVRRDLPSVVRRRDGHGIARSRGSDGGLLHAVEYFRLLVGELRAANDELRTDARRLLEARTSCS